MPNPCLLCAATPTRPYKITRGAVVRHVDLCAEHAAPVEHIIKAGTTKRRNQSSPVLDMSQLKQSRAVLARRAAQKPASAPRRGAKGSGQAQSP